MSCPRCPRDGDTLTARGAVLAERLWLPLLDECGPVQLVAALLLAHDIIAASVARQATPEATQRLLDLLQYHHQALEMAADQQGIPPVPSAYSSH